MNGLEWLEEKQLPNGLWPYHYIDDDVSNNVTYWYKLTDVDFSGVSSEYGPISATPNDRIVEPEAFYLDQNYPNPFNPKTTINYELPTTNYVELSIYSLLGQKVTTLVSQEQKAGYHQVEWDASGFASGVYFYRLKCDAGFIQIKKLILLE